MLPGSMYVPTEEVCGECNGGAGQPGFFKGTFGNEACTQCPGNGETDSIGATDVSACKCGAGYRHDATDNDNPCKYCPANQYKPNVENSECTDCPVGSSVPEATGVSSLVKTILSCICDAGRERDSENNECDLCAAGKFRAASSSNSDVH